MFKPFLLSFDGWQRDRIAVSAGYECSGPRRPRSSWWLPELHGFTETNCQSSPRGHSDTAQREMALISKSLVRMLWWFAMSRTFNALDNDTVKVVFDNLGLQACGNCRGRSSSRFSIMQLVNQTRIVCLAVQILSCGRSQRLISTHSADAETWRSWVLVKLPICMKELEPWQAKAAIGACCGWPAVRVLSVGLRLLQTPPQPVCPGLDVSLLSRLLASGLQRIKNKKKKLKKKLTNWKKKNLSKIKKLLKNKIEKKNYWKKTIIRKKNM